MSIKYNDNILIQANKPIDGKYLNVSASWGSVLQVNTAIPQHFRHQGLTVNIMGVEYWYRDGVSDLDLIIKNNGSGSVNVNNGLTINNNQIVSLGGVLTGNTYFNGGVNGYTLQYTTNLSAYYTNRSLVDKEYVDSTSQGIRPKQAVNVATTENILLTGLLIIDGYQLINGNRVLVKNQNNLTTNGVYIASAGAWSRATDFDNSSNVVSGSYMFVLTGDTNAGYSFVLTTEDPIDVGVDDLVFTEFTRINPVVSGIGIDVTNVDSTYVVDFNGTNIVGNGLIWNNNQISLNTTNQNYLSNTITGVTNGLKKYSCHDVSLGGVLTGNTMIELPYASTSKFVVGNGSNLTNWFGGRVEICRDDSSILNNKAVIGTRGDSNNYSISTFNTTTGVETVSVIGGNNFGYKLNNNALVYNNCYHSNYTNRSLVDKEFVVNTTISGASNGLCVTSRNVKLGGLLTENTKINTNNKSFCLTTNNTYDYGLFNYSLNNIYNQSKLVICSRDSGMTGNWWSVSACPLNFNVQNWENTSNGSSFNVNRQHISFGNKIANVTKSVYLDANALRYDGDYSSCFIDNSLVDKRFVVNRVYDNSNIVNVNNIGNVYTTTRNDDFIGVDGASCIFLFDAPVVGQRIIIADICGNALLDPITVDGNGFQINDAECSTINTNYGSITYIYNGLKWSAVGFVN
jgi:hypothetical protein